MLLRDDQAREELEKILNSEEYQIYYVDTRTTLEIWWDKAKAWLAEKLATLFPDLEETSGVSGTLLISIICIVIVGLLILFILLAVKNKKNRTIRDQQPFHTKNELDWSYQQHAEEAKKQEALGNYSLSTRHMFLALLLFFHQKEWLAAKVWKTNWEYYDELRKAHKDAANLFFNFALLFDRAAYGEQQIKKEEYALYRDEALSWFNENNDFSQNG